MLRRLLLAIKIFFIGENSTSISLSDDHYKKKIEEKEKNLQLFHKIVGDNPLKHIDWIIENGLEKFNSWYKSYEDGSIGRRQLLNSYEQHRVELTKYTQEKYHTRESMTYGYIKGSREEKEADELLRNSLSTRDYRIHSSANQMQMKNDISPRTFGELIRKIEHDECIQVVELRGGIGNKVIARYEENSLTTKHIVHWTNGSITQEEGIVIATDAAMKRYDIPSNNRIGRRTEVGRVEALNQNWAIGGYISEDYFRLPSRKDSFKVEKDCVIQMKLRSIEEIYADALKQKNSSSPYGNLFT